MRGFAIGDAERAEVVAFLESLTDRGFLTNPAFAMPEDMARQTKASGRRLNGHGSEQAAR